MPFWSINVRGIHGYTAHIASEGLRHGVRRMGMPSIGIYSWELLTIRVENIMRIGSTGAMQENINLRDIVIAQGACTDSSWAGQYHLPGTFAPIATITCRDLRRDGERAGAAKIPSATSCPPTASTAMTAI